MNCIKRLGLIDFQKLKLCFGNSFGSRLSVSTSNEFNTAIFKENQILDSDKEALSEEKITKDILFKVNNQIKEKTHSRLFAVIQFGERKFKITTEDIIALNSYFPAKVGDKIRLEKVLAVGSTDFTLLGRPVLSKDLIRIEATVIEKTYIIPRPLFRHGLHYRRLHWFRTPYILFCINSIKFTNALDSLPDVENVQNRVIY